MKKLTKIVSFFFLISAGNSAFAYIINWQDAQINSGSSTSPLSATHTAPDGSIASYEVSFTNDTTGIDLFTNTLAVSQGTNANANANANFSGTFNIVSEDGSTSPVTADIIVTLSGGYETTVLGSEPVFEINGISYLMPFNPITVIPFTFDIATSYDMYAFLFSSSFASGIGATDTSNGIMSIEFDFPSQSSSVPEPGTVALFILGLLTLSFFRFRGSSSRSFEYR